MQNRKSRGETISTTMTLLSGLDSKNFNATKEHFEKMGFIYIPTADIESDKVGAYAKAIERYNEAYSPFCIMIAIHDSGKVKKIIKDVNDFEHYCNSNDIVGEVFMAWYPTAEEKTRLVEETRQKAELAGNPCI